MRSITRFHKCSKILSSTCAREYATGGGQQRGGGSNITGSFFDEPSASSAGGSSFLQKDFGSYGTKKSYGGADNVSRILGDTNAAAPSILDAPFTQQNIPRLLGEMTEGTKKSFVSSALNPLDTDLEYSSEDIESLRKYLDNLRLERRKDGRSMTAEEEQQAAKEDSTRKNVGGGSGHVFG